MDEAETARLEQLSEKWLRASQRVLEALLQAARRSAGDDADGSGGMTMPQLIRALGVDSETVRYDEHREEFVNPDAAAVIE